MFLYVKEEEETMILTEATVLSCLIASVEALMISITLILLKLALASD